MVKPAKQTQPNTDDWNPEDWIMTKEEIEEMITRFEKQYGMTSEEFLKRREEGTAPDSWEAMTWVTLLKYR